MAGPVRDVVIVGGGAAGWLTAGVLAAPRGTSPGFAPRVTLVESPEVRTLGVGEGTWPSMRDTLRHMGISETELVRECELSFKQGTRFMGWLDGGAEQYHHPFTAPQAWGELDLAPHWRERARRRNPDPGGFAGMVSAQPRLCDHGRAPKQAGTPEFAAVANYAYHLDAGQFGAFLEDHCTRVLGVRHIRDHVRGVVPADNGDIAALATAGHGELGGDLFVDCTGFAARLVGGHYGIPARSSKQWLFNDAALVLQVPYPEADTPIVSHTLASAREAGWIWDIGLPARRGLGYVHSRAHTDGEDPERTLRDYVRSVCGVDPDTLDAPRLITFEPGYRETSWHRNCVAVGVSAGFVEPLEASALALIEMSAAMIRDHMPMTRGTMDDIAARFNAAFAYRWARVEAFLKLHYALSRRDDSDYWRDHRNGDSCPPALAAQLRQWRYRSPSRYDFDRIEEVFPAASYAYVLYGMDFATAGLAAEADGRYHAAARRQVDECRRAGDRMLRGLPSNRELIDSIRRDGMPSLPKPAL